MRTPTPGSVLVCQAWPWQCDVCAPSACGVMMTTAFVLLLVCSEQWAPIGVVLASAWYCSLAALNRSPALLKHRTKAYGLLVENVSVSTALLVCAVCILYWSVMVPIGFVWLGWVLWPLLATVYVMLQNESGLNAENQMSLELLLLQGVLELWPAALASLAYVASRITPTDKPSCVQSAACVGFALCWTFGLYVCVQITMRKVTYAHLAIFLELLVLWSGVLMSMTSYNKECWFGLDTGVVRIPVQRGNTNVKVGTKCVICYEGLRKYAWLRLPCHHTHEFHVACLQAWGRSTCPLCRAEFVLESVH